MFKEQGILLLCLCFSLWGGWTFEQQTDHEHLPQPTLIAEDPPMKKCPLRHQSIKVGYWGSYRYSSLENVCQLYNVIHLSFLTPWSGVNVPVLHTTYCITNGTEPCWSLPEQIKFCQEKNVLFFLSLGGALDKSPGFQSKEEAIQMAHMIHLQYGHGHFDKRPLKSVIMDGIDLDLEHAPASGYLFLTEFLTELKRLEPQWCFSAAPQCYLSHGLDQNVGHVIQNWSFDLVMIQFFNNPSCENGSEGFYDSFQQWKQLTNNARIVIGALLTSGSGMVSASVFQKQLLHLKSEPLLAGWFIWAADSELAIDFCHSIYF